MSAQPHGPVRVDPGLSTKGPRLQSFVWSDELRQFMEVVSEEVRHGADKPTEAFGLLRNEVRAENSNKGREIRMFLERNEVGSPLVKERCDKQQGVEEVLNRFACNLRRCVRLVDISTSYPDPDDELTAVRQVSVAYRQLDDANALRSEMSVEEWGTLTERELNSAAMGCPTTQTEDVVVEGTAVGAGGLLVLSDEVVPVDKKRAVKRRVTIDAPGWPTLEDKEREAETGLEIVVSRTVVAPTFNIPNNGNHAGFEYNLKAIDKWRSLFTERELSGDWQAFAYTYRQPITYSFPAYLAPPGNNHFQVADAFLVHHKRSLFTLRTRRREGFSKRVNAEVTVDFTARYTNGVLQAQPAAQGLWQPRTNTLVYRGSLFSIFERDVLNDVSTVVATTNPDDTYWGFAQESITFDASVPVSATDYVNAIGTPRIVHEIVEPWAFGLWKRSTFRIIVE